MKWFGEPWPHPEMRAAVCEDDADRVPRPPDGERCPFCGETFPPDAQGVMLQHLASYGWFSRPVHLACLVGSVLSAENP